MNQQDHTSTDKAHIAPASLDVDWQNFFTRAFDGIDAPPMIRQFSETFVRRFGIKGICDPAYIANVTAYELRLGDGQGTFKEVDRLFDQTDVTRVASRLAFSYASMMRESSPPGDKLEIITLLTNAMATSAPVSA